ncbi:DUF2269 family protein [Commensalibacter papalotli (ex Servin-Garciduenas et al. 2014)]|uniref:Integral membrane protein n=1 Tax=Commensalibacter papalotli (ex Servin-Garciduenas et al. 2014) TaxID=1208583 RepID=W7E4C9_9PROT|nr:DUF2269 family protein [Commensalibacter papalotli (ex Servin-Garciduenas et al. 2014)]EUK17936.1 hypothetical protein COMX_08085 [Commensalibacter papalotli (ex Servin-Garciduenas et al. 2014)]
MIGLLKTLHVLCAVMVTGMGFGVFIHTILLIKQGQKRQSLQLQIVALCSSFILFFPALIALILSGFYLSYLSQFLITEPWIILAIIIGIIFGTLCLSIAYFCLALPFQKKSFFLKIASVFSCIGWIGFTFAMAAMILKQPLIG